jgi:isocitrate/isopropylmalate dehydrogenase
MQILVLPGDGIGPEVATAMLQVRVAKRVGNTGPSHRPEQQPALVLRIT